METEYRTNNNCYRTKTMIPLLSKPFEFYAVIDTGASSTTMALETLINDKPSGDLIKSLDEHAQRLGIRPQPLHGGTVKRNKEDAYTYAACFKNVIVGGHLMEKFYVNIMINGADDIFVIGNDFLNAYNYQHKAGENKLVIENPNTQKYNENLERLHTLNSKLLSTLRSMELTVDEKFGIIKTGCHIPVEMGFSGKILTFLPEN